MHKEKLINYETLMYASLMTAGFTAALILLKDSWIFIAMISVLAVILTKKHLFHRYGFESTVYAIFEGYLMIAVIALSIFHGRFGDITGNVACASLMAIALCCIFKTISICNGSESEGCVNGGYQLSDDNIRIDQEFDYFIENGQNIWCFYIETWFDVDRYFGTRTSDNDDEWINFYALYEQDTQKWRFIYFIDSSNKSTEYDWTDFISEDDRNLIISKICLVLWKDLKNKGFIIDNGETIVFSFNYFIFNEGDHFNDFCSWLDRNFPGGLQSFLIRCLETDKAPFLTPDVINQCERGE